MNNGNVVLLLTLFLCLIFSIYSFPTCSTNCSTVTKNINNKSLIDLVQCSIQNTECPVSSKGYPTAPENELSKHNPGWYLYSDPVNYKYQKIGLNLSWSPGDDASIQYLNGFKVIVQREQIKITQYFCLQQNLSFFQHIAAKFVHDSIGYCDKTSIEPGQIWTVIIQGIPESPEGTNKKFLNFDINIPKCSELENVSDCYQQKLFTAYLVKNDNFCKKHSVVVIYNVPPAYGNNGLIILSKRISGKSDEFEINTWKNLTINGSFEVLLPKDFDYQANYSITIKGDKSTSLEKNLPLDFQDCANDREILPLPVILVLIGLLFIVIFGVIAKCIKQKGIKHLCQAVSDGKKQTDVFEEDNERQVQCILQKNSKIIKVFIIFVCDHQFHSDVISSFANFLATDLGFDVMSELYQTNVIYADPISWMEKNFSEADKIIIIWSPEAAQRWHAHCQYKSCSNSQNSNIRNDLFTPILIKINADLFCNLNMKRYFFVNFDYYDKDSIPTHFIEKYPQLHYTLMDKMEELYFQLKDLEMYAPGMAIKHKLAKFKHYSDPEICKFGNDLKEKIRNMHAFVKKNSLFQVDNSNNFALNNSIFEIEINCLNIVPLSNALSSHAVAIDGTDDAIDNVNCLSNLQKNNLAVSAGKSESDNESRSLLNIDNPSMLEICVKPEKVLNSCGNESYKIMVSNSDVGDVNNFVIDSNNISNININDYNQEKMCHLELISTNYDNNFSEFHSKESKSSDFQSFEVVEHSQPNEQYPTGQKIIHGQFNIEIAPLEIADDPMESLRKINNLNGGNPIVIE